MTRDEARAKCIEAMKDAIDKEAFGRFESINSDVVAIAFDALHGIAFVEPLEATEEMVDAAWRLPSLGGIEPGYRDVFRAMAARGDLTNPPEKKP